MAKSDYQNAIRINHRGFLPKGQKRFVLTEKIGDCTDFSVYLIDNVQEILVYQGKLEPFSHNGQTYYVGDLSEVCRQGDYFISVDGYRSRQFVIYDGIYDICNRVMLEYFTYQRCGHPLGWNGECHLDDGYIKETGEHVDLSGGYHQSCDLRKSPGGISIGVLAMLRFALKDKSQWGQILTVDEARWALEYYLKVIQENGQMYNTLNLPFGWEGRVFYKSPAPSSAQWNVTSALATGYIYFKDKDDEFASKCLSTAIRSYEYLMGDTRPKEVYRHPDKYPMGMDPDFFYDQCKPDTTADMAYKITVSADLYRATKEQKYLEVMKKYLPTVLDSLEGFALKRDDDKRKTVSSSCSYTWLMSGLLCLCDSYELLGDIYSLKDKLRTALDELCQFADKSPWRSIEIIYSDEDLDAPCGHVNETRRQSMPHLVKYGNYYYSPRCDIEPSYACYMGIFLARGSKLLNDARYMGYAQSIADLLLGTNRLDSSRIRAIGHNHSTHAAYGQFFPSTPFIPGAVGVGYSDPGGESEYDMPCVGLAMYLLSELSS